MQNQHQYKTMEPRNEEFNPASQLLMQDHLDHMHINARPPDRNISENKPVLNYSIQTGEEFALEFMRDRVNLKKPVFPNIVGDPSFATGYKELQGMLGISHPGSESGSDISLLTKADKGPKEFDQRSSSMNQDRSNYGSVQSMPRSLSNQDNNRVFHGIASSGASDSSSIMMKVLCSFGGKILPRPRDGKLRYVGGETHIVCIRKDIRWQELLQKMSSIYNDAHVIKYQLPGEELDALVTVSCDEDLRNMLEECNDLDKREGSQKLRVFLFSMNDLDDTEFGLGSADGDSEIQYVVAVNGMDLGSRNHSSLHGASTFENNILEFDGLNTKNEAERVLMGSIGVTSSSLTGNVNPLVTSQSSQSMLPTESYSMFYNDQIIRHGETSQYPMHHGLEPSSNSAFREIPVSLPTPGLINQGMMNEGYPPSDLPVQNSDIPAIQVKIRGDSFVQQESDPGKGFSLETPHPVPSLPFDGNLQGKFSAASVTVAAPVEHQPTLPSRNKGNHQHYEETSSQVNAMNSMQIPKSDEDDHRPTSANAFSPGDVDANSNVVDLNVIEPPPLPNRVYYSERIPREQAELLNRSTKSDDAHGSQLLVSDFLSDFNWHNSVTESNDKLHDGDLLNMTSVSNSTAKPLQEDGQAVDDGFSQLQNYEQLPVSTSQMNSKLSQPVNSESKQEFASNAENKVTIHEDQDQRTENETNHSKGNYSNLMVDETSSTDHPAFHRVSSVVHNENTRESNYDVNVQPDSLSLTGNSIQDVHQDSPSDVVLRPAQGDIMIDIDDRFPRDFLYDMFSKAILSDDSSNISPLPTDRVDLSLIMENHEPKSWSYFQKLAQDGLDGISLLDQDHPGFSSALRTVQGDSRSQQFAPLRAVGVSGGHIEPSLHFGEEDHKILPVETKTEATILHPNYDPSPVKDNENKYLNAMIESIRLKESEYEVGKRETNNFALPRRDPSLGGFDMSTLQLINNEDLEELRELGSGTFGTVYHGKWRGTDVAIKRIKKSCFTGRSSEQERLTVEFWREADILSKLHHPNVVAFYGVVQDGPGGTLATVAEYMVDGSLRHVLLRKDRYLDRRKRLIIAMDAAFGMEYLHAKNIVHFDLKCDNLLVNLKDPLRPICKVGDFGLSKIKRNTLVSGGVRGTLPWMAPELLNGSSNKVSEKVDVFSFGIVLWEILTGEEPYANMHYGAIIGGIVNNTLRPTIPSYCDSEWRTLMEQCWAPNPAVRPSFTEIARRLRVMSAAASQTKGQPHKPSK
ncbi:putative serine/threonine-protein kinase [Senna tora]|uniref:Putative serine/threonine-protein kinase n=1 Tax=Senna tora TaxID=362788 RepID=A0A835C8K4_9FABA|nr:putative serine/threonine-protein kinase [Senna tora]